MAWNAEQVKLPKEQEWQRATFNNYVPTLIPHPNKLENIIDIQLAYEYTLILCSSNTDQLLMIIKNWCRSHPETVPDDIIKLLLLFCKYSAVYSTRNEFGSGHSKITGLSNEYGWNEIDALKEVNVIKIATGCDFSLFLTDDGNVWFCGAMKLFEGFDKVAIPRQAEYFMKNGIKIVDIECGNYHAMVLDENGRVYSWGENYAGQCGIGKKESGNVTAPTLIETLKEYVVDRINCGAYHSVIKTINDEYYIFGKNKYGESFGSEREVFMPLRLDCELKEKYGMKSIIDIVPGYNDTFVICTK